MISFSLDALYGLINSAFWPFVRLLAFIAAAPVLGESSIPARAKVGLAAMVTLALAPTLPAAPAISPASFTSLWIIAQQILIGVSMGLIVRIAFAAVQTAGELIGLQMGLSFASFFDPATGANTAVLSRLMNMIAMLVFISVDGHLLLIQGLHYSFDVLPATQGSFDVEGWQVLFYWSAQVLNSGILLALPLVFTLLCISLALGILNRTAQQLSVFAVGFPISLLVGLILLAVVLPQTAPFLSKLFQDTLQALQSLIGALAH